MRFVGFTVEKEYEKSFEHILKKSLKTVDTKVITVAINEKSIFNIKNINFDAIILDRNLKGIKEILKNTKYLILNEDNVNTNNLEDLDLNVITYGFGNKCTVTASSIEEDEMLICIQRTINNSKDAQIEPQEFRIVRNEGQKNEYLNMALATIMFLYR